MSPRRTYRGGESVSKTKKKTWGVKLIYAGEQCFSKNGGIVVTLLNWLFENPSCLSTSGLLQAPTHHPFRFYLRLRFMSGATWNASL